MTPLTTPIFDFYKVIRALTTALTTPTPSPLKICLIDMEQLRTEYPSTFCETGCAAQWQLFEVIFKWTVNKFSNLAN